MAMATVGLRDGKYEEGEGGESNERGANSPGLCPGRVRTQAYHIIILPPLPPGSNRDPECLPPTVGQPVPFPQLHQTVN